MATKLNSAGAANARALVKAGKVNPATGWELSAEEGNKLLGPNGDDWANYGKWFLAVHDDQPEKTKAHYGYPFGKGSDLWRMAVVSAKGRAAQQGAKAVEDVCTELLDAIDAKKETAVTMKRAYSTFDVKEVKSADPTKRYFEALATTPTPDRMGDTVQPKGAKFKLPLPFLYQHDAHMPIGQITEAKVTGAGIKVKGYVENLDGPPTLKERLDVAWAEMISGLVRGVSIGFVDLVTEAIKGADGYISGFNIQEWEWLELSAVTIPANAEASITMIKSIDEQLLAASGQSMQQKSSGAITKPPGATGFSKAVKLVTNQGEKVKTYSEQIKEFEATRQAKKARMDALMEAASTDGRTLSQEEAEEHDTLKGDLKAIDAHLARLSEHEKDVGSNAAKVTGSTNAGDGGTGSGANDKRTPIITGMKSNLPAGMALARYVKALAFAKGNNAEAQQYAEQWKDSTPEVQLALKSAIAAGTVADGTWAGPLVYNTNMASEFLSFLRPQTIIGKLTGLRMVPFNIRFATQTSGSTVGWVGEGLGKPVSKLALGSGSLGFAKAAGIVVITQELARYSSPAAELLVRDDMAAQMIQFLDGQFIDPSVAAVASVNPASVTNGAGNIVQATATWDTQAHVLADIKTFLQGFADNNIMLDSSAAWIMTPSAALALSMLVTANGVQAFPDITLDGGTLFGIRVITSNSVPHSVSAGSIVALVKAAEIQMADDGQIAIDVSQEASLLMDSAPSTQTSATPTGSSVVSMFQTNSLAVRVERVINWARRRSYAVGYIDNMHTS